MVKTATIDGNSVGIRLLVALSELDSNNTVLEPEDIHQLRVAIKQTRAWLKLRGKTGKTPTYHRLLENLRGLSAALSGQRDRDVALKTLAKLARKYPGKKAQRLIDVLSQQLAQRQAPSTERSALSATVDQIRQDLLSFTQQVVACDTQTAKVRRRYAKMGKTAEVALTSESCADLHAWRKQVKTLAYQLDMLQAPDPPRKKLIQQLTKLGSKLGDVHDLCFLQVMIEETLAQAKCELDLAPLLKRIARERKTLIDSVRKHYQSVRTAPYI